MVDLISRQAAIATAVRAAIDWHRLANPQYSIAYCIGEAMRQLPSAQPERKKGKWINHRKDDGHNIADCDQCGNAIQWFDGDEIPRYCCMCGADMKGEDNGT